jgi:hypothetical protein
MSESTPGQIFVRAVAPQVRLDLPEGRVADLAKAAAPIPARLHGFTAVNPCETGPALSVDASWN